MKRAILYIGILIGSTSCNNSVPKVVAGDLLFQVGKGSAMGTAITDATGKEGQINFTHVGIALDSDSVIEASSEGGVRISSLHDFLLTAANINGAPAVVGFRLRDTTGVAAALGCARRLLGQPYDYSFRPDNGKLYCSELVWESYRMPTGEPLFTAQPMNFRAADGTMPPFWITLFARTGDTIPEGVLGTNPTAMAQEKILKQVYRWY